MIGIDAKLSGRVESISELKKGKTGAVFAYLKITVSQPRDSKGKFMTCGLTRSALVKSPRKHHRKSSRISTFTAKVL
jgi:hypothetical protein